VDRGAEAVAEFGQRGVGLGGDEHHEAAAAVVVHLGGRAAGMGAGGEGAGLAAALQQSADPGGADAEQVGDLLAGAALRVAGADHPLTEVLRVGFHVRVPFLLC
jgi:hypothetical protein